MTELHVRLKLMAWPKLFKFGVDDAEAVSSGNQLDSTSDSWRDIGRVSSYEKPPDVPRSPKIRMARWPKMPVV